MSAYDVLGNLLSMSYVGSHPVFAISHSMTYVPLLSPFLQMMKLLLVSPMDAKTQGHHADSWIITLVSASQTSTSPRRACKNHRLLGPTSRVSDSVGVGWA